MEIHADRGWPAAPAPARPPQTHAIWHKVAPALASASRWCSPTCAVTAIRPSQRAPDTNYAKRVMARDMLRVMRALGHPRFNVLAHDRGARVAHRLAVDHGDAVGRLVLLDIAPTLAMYEQTTHGFARAYWHWFFLIQPAPLPERLIEADPAAYVRDVMGRRSAGLAPFDPRALAEYTRALALPGTRTASAEDFRRSAGIDVDHDREDRVHGRRLAVAAARVVGRTGRGAPLLSTARGMAAGGERRARRAAALRSLHRRRSAGRVADARDPLSDGGRSMTARHHRRRHS